MSRQWKAGDRKEDGGLVLPRVHLDLTPAGRQLPRSKLHIPRTRGVTSADLWQERCAHTPQEQRWGVGWVGSIPDEPGTKFEHIIIVLLATFSDEQLAQQFVQQIRSTHKNRPAFTFKMGYWQVLPVPRWLKDSESI